MMHVAFVFFVFVFVSEAKLFGEIHSKNGRGGTQFNKYSCTQYSNGYNFTSSSILFFITE